MSVLRRFLHDRRAAGAAEFALILPLFMLILLGTLDAGRYAWEFNRAAKATQVGARWTVVTDLVPGGDAATGLKNYSFALQGGLYRRRHARRPASPGTQSSDECRTSIPQSRQITSESTTIGRELVFPAIQTVPMWHHLQLLP